MASAYSTNHVDYLQRTVVELSSSLSTAPATRASLRSLWRIDGIGRPEKSWKPQAFVDKKPRAETEDLLVGMHGRRVAVAFFVRGRPQGLSVHLGTWVAGTGGTESAHREGNDILRSSLESLYGSIAISEAQLELPGPLSGIVLGVPTLKAPDPLDGALAIDRLVRALLGTDWACLILAEAVEQGALAALRNGVLKEIKAVESAVKAEGAPSPLAEYYLELLKTSLQTVSAGRTLGAWRTGVYLLGDATSYHRLASLWRGIFSGDESMPDPVSVWDNADSLALASAWALPDGPGAPGPGGYQHPLQYQTLLTSRQLSAYIHLPRLETSGFAINEIPQFDAVPAPTAEAGSLQVGRVVSANKTTETDYDKLADLRYTVGLRALTKHMFVPGVTGAGKTRTIFTLLKQLAAAGVPFLVIEPAKTEYRELLNHEGIGDALRVFSVGNEEVSPLRLNPFELTAGTSVLGHIDLLRSVFSVGLGLWTPLPQILEECLHLLYQDKGWDVARDVNRRTEDRTDPRAVPTLSELITKVDEVMARSVWDPEATSRIRGALRDRLKSLRVGSKGRMFDVRHSIPMDTILSRPTVLELDSLGDDDDKAFLMGLMLIRLVEHRRSAPKDDGRSTLKHVLVFEEAHRLLANAPSKGEEGAASPRSKAVDSFTNLLSEVRAYGQGVIVADQVPVKLAPDVIKNTNVKIAHRIVDAEDRKVLAGSMIMTDEQSRALATLLPGRAAVFSEGDDAPLLVQVPGTDEKPRPDNASVKEHMRAAMRSYDTAFALHSGCADTGEGGGVACDASKLVLEGDAFRRDFARLVLSILDDPTSVHRLMPSIEWHLAPFLLRDARKGVALRCLIARASDWFAERRGSQANWPYEETAKLSESLRLALLAHIEGTQVAERLAGLRGLLRELHTRPFPPHAHCEEICPDAPPVCLYQHAVADVLSDASLRQAWNDADPLNASLKAAAWTACQRAAEQLVEWTPAQSGAIRRSALCYGQKLLLAYPTLTSHVRLEGVFRELQQEAASTELIFPGTRGTVGRD